MGNAEYANIPIYYPNIFAIGGFDDDHRSVFGKCLADLYLLFDFPFGGWKCVDYGLLVRERAALGVDVDHTAEILLSLDYVLCDFQELFKGNKRGVAVLGCA